MAHLAAHDLGEGDHDLGEGDHDLGVHEGLSVQVGLDNASGPAALPPDFLKRFRDLLDAPACDDPACDDPACDDPACDAQPLDLAQLYRQAVTVSRSALPAVVRETRQQLIEELRGTGARFQAEQDRLYAAVMEALPGAVREAAAKGQRTAVVLRFGGVDKLEEFCYLYMLKGPYKREQREEMKVMGVRPLLPRLRHELQQAGFGVFHTWHRATNENTLTVAW